MPRRRISRSVCTDYQEFEPRHVRSSRDDPVRRSMQSLRMQGSPAIFAPHPIQPAEPHPQMNPPNYDDLRHHDPMADNQVEPA